MNRQVVVSENIFVVAKNKQNLYVLLFVVANVPDLYTRKLEYFALVTVNVLNLKQKYITPSEKINKRGKEIILLEEGL